MMASLSIGLLVSKIMPSWKPAAYAAVSFVVLDPFLL